MMLADTGTPREPAPIFTLRRYLLILFLAGLLGTGAELVLLEHTEDYWQWVPLALMGSSLMVLGWRFLDRRAATLRVFQGTMVLFVLSGFVGLFLHYKGNAEFELEMYPTLGGLKLFWEALKGATPALAPGTMIGLGVLGLLYTYRHPALTPPPVRLSDHDGGIA